MPDKTSNQYILVVDDDPTMQLVLQGMIEKTGFKPVIAENGEKALQFVELGGENIAVVLLDRHMPDMDGFQVVEKLKEFEDNKGIPVIMQSGSKTPQEVREAIDAGIFYYLTKPFKMEALQTVLNFAVEKAELRKVLKERVAGGYLPVNLLKSSSFEFTTMNEAKKMAILLSCFFPDPFEVFPGMVALLTNAVEHGVLEIGYDTKTDLIVAGAYDEEIVKRQKDKANRDKIIEVQFINTDGRHSVRITDPGSGFDWKTASAFEQEREGFAHGYGVLKALRCFDEVKYNTAGNQVMVSVFEK